MKSKISFDLITETMYETGKDLRSHYRETSTGGLAKNIVEINITIQTWNKNIKCALRKE